jgi:DNA-binding transcriptional LysR family regulator
LNALLDYGHGPDPARPAGAKAYIGEADDVGARLRSHFRAEDKEFFERLVIVVAKDDNLTKAHARFLESQLIRAAREAGSVSLANATRPDFHILPEADRADMEFFVSQLRLMLPILGFDLFRRTGRGIEPTERGRMFLYEAERVSADLMNLSDVARRLSGVEVESLIMGIGSGLATMLIPQMFTPGQFPSNLHLEIRTASTRVVFEELHNDRLDMGIVAQVDAERVPSGLSGTTLFDLDFVLIMRPDHPLAKGKGPVDIGSLVHEPIIMNELSVGYGQIVGSLFHDLGIRPRIRAVADNVETIKVIVQSGLGIAAIPAGAADIEIQLERLASRPISPARKITITAYRSRQGLSRRKEALFQRLCDNIRAEPKP